MQAKEVAPLGLSEMERFLGTQKGYPSPILYNRGGQR